MCQDGRIVPCYSKSSALAGPVMVPKPKGTLLPTQESTKKGMRGPVGRKAAPIIPNVNPTVNDESVEETTASPTNLALAGTIPIRFNNPPRPSNRSSWLEDMMMLKSQYCSLAKTLKRKFTILNLSALRTPRKSVCHGRCSLQVPLLLQEVINFYHNISQSTSLQFGKNANVSSQS
mmetsp:Transcript_2209/g.4071  ORF Transcript_2209/g.4071 Transcript_2209/m.4071 type:complete len:176 (+) Transcript_2209:364-891(+)